MSQAVKDGVTGALAGQPVGSAPKLAPDKVPARLKTK
jgi:hypothetical protein